MLTVRPNATAVGASRAAQVGFLMLIVPLLPTMMGVSPHIRLRSMTTPPAACGAFR